MEDKIIYDEARYRELADSLPQIVFETDLDGNITFANRKGFELTGYSEEDAKNGFNIMRLFHPEEQSKAVENINRIRNEETLSGNEYRLVKKDGSTFPVTVFSSPIIVEGRVRGLRGIVIDITEHQRMQEALKKSEEKFSKAFHASPAAIIISALEDGKIIDVNESATRDSGFKREEMIGHSGRELNIWLNPDERQRITQLLKEKGSFSGREFILRKKSGEPRHVLFAAEKFESDGKEYCVSAQVDITERKQAEEALKASEEKFRQITEKSVVGTYIIQDNRLVYVNPAAARMFGYEPEEIIDKLSPADVIHPDDIGIVAQKIKERLQGKTEEANTQYRGIKKDGSVIHIEVYAMLLDYQGKPAVMGTLIDITNRYLAEERLRESEERYRAIFEQASDSLVILDMETDRFVYFNDKAHENLGYTREEFSRLKIGDIEAVYMDKIPDLTGEQFFKKGASSTFETKYRTKNGQLRDIQVSSRGIHMGGKLMISNIWRDITESKQAETRVRESETRYRAIFEQAQDSIVLIDTETGRFIGFNDQSHENLGYTREEFARLRVLDFDTGVQVSDEGRTNILRSFGPDTKDSFETRHRTKSGDIRDILVSRQALTINGKLCALAIWYDITERKQAERKIRLNAAHLKDLLDLHQMADSTEQVIVEHMLEASMRSLQSQFSFIGLMSEDESVLNIHAWSTDVMEQCKVTGNPLHFPVAKAGLWGEAVRQRRPIIVNDYDASEDKMGYPAGHVPINRFLCIPVFSADKIVAVAAVANKMTDYDGSDVNALTSLLHEMWNLIERKRAEEQLRESEERYRTIFEQALDSIALIDFETGAILDFNDVAHRNLGYTREEFARLNLNDIDASSQNKPAVDEQREILRIKNRSTFETKHRTKNDEIRDVYVNAGAIKIKGKTLGLSIWHDITERKKAEEQLQVLYRKETEMRKELETEMNRRAEFTRALVHELKTPLTPIVASSDGLLELLAEEPVKSLAGNINRGAHNLNKRIDELLDIARSELNVLEVKLEPADLRPVLVEVTAEMRVLAQKNGQTLEARIPSSLPVVNADRKRIKQVVENFLTNALKFTPREGQIVVGARRTAGKLIIEVKDTGRGLTKAEMERIFSPYYRKESDRNRLSGLGIGLSLCKKFIDLHGGEIWVKSRHGKGSTFGFSLPVIPRE